MSWFDRNCAWVIPLCVLGPIAAILGGALWAGLSHEARTDQATERCGLYGGDMVRSVLDDRPGMVTNSYAGWVWVRFAQPSNQTNVRLLGEDGSIALTPYSTVKMACWEVARK